MLDERQCFRDQIIYVDCLSGFCVLAEHGANIIDNPAGAVTFINYFLQNFACLLEIWGLFRQPTQTGATIGL